MKTLTMNSLVCAFRCMQRSDTTTSIIHLWSILKGCHLLAQGCAERATLGKRTAAGPTLKGLQQPKARVWCNPFRVGAMLGWLPRVARSAQPWANRWHPVGILCRPRTGSKVSLGFPGYSRRSIRSLLITTQQSGHRKAWNACLAPWLLAFATTHAFAVAVSPAELASAHQWSEAKFASIRQTESREAGLVVVANHGPVQKNARGDKPLRLVNTDYAHGLYCHAFSKIVVRLPGPGKSLSALIGVDSNDQTSGGRGSVEFLVQVAGQQPFRSGVLREGMVSKPVNVELNSATEFVLQVNETPDGIACDQADWVDAKVSLQDGKELWLADLPVIEHLKAAYSAEPPFSFNYGGKASTELLAGWKQSPATPTVRGHRIESTRLWTDPVTGLQVRCVAVEYTEFPTVEWTLYLRNNGPHPTPLISDLQALDTRLDKNGGGDFVLHHHTGDCCTPDSYQPHQLVLSPESEHSFAPAGGRPTSVAFPYFNIASPGGGVIMAVGWPGQWKASFSCGADSVLHVRAGQELTHFKLEPGEEVRTPLIVLQFWNGDRLRAQNIWRQWMLAHNSPQLGKPLRPIFSSCGGGFFPGIQCTEATERQFITAFSQAGLQLDYWWLDAGWYPCDGNWPKVGTWEPDTSRFPRGLKPVSDCAHTNKMGLIVWFEPERVHPGTWLYTNHPSWLLGQDGQQKLFNLGNPTARAWLTDHVDGLLTREGIDLYRQDFNIDPLAFWRANDTADRQGITEIRHIEGYLAYWDELRRRHPGMLIDSCASGGRRNDLETLRRAVPLLRSDYQAFDGNPAFAPGNQGHTFGLSSWLPYYGQGVYYSERDFVYSARSYMSPAFGLAVDVRKAGVNWPLLRRTYEQWREVADCYLGDFYPLTPYRLDEDVWLAWQFDLPESGKGLVQVFRRDRSCYQSARFKLQGLDLDARYLVTNLDEKNSAQAMTGRDLFQGGLPVQLTSQPDSALLTYRKLE